MAKNLVPEIIKMLGVNLGEEFIIEGKPNYVLFHFEENGVKVRNARREDVFFDKADAAILQDLILGRRELIKIPWQPKLNEKYWTFKTFKYTESSIPVLCITFNYYENCFSDIALLQTGWVYQTEKEAIDALPVVAKKLGLAFETVKL